MVFVNLRYFFFSENSEVILERCKNFEDIDKIEEKDFLNEDDKTEWLTST